MINLLLTRQPCLLLDDMRSELSATPPGSTAITKEHWLAYAYLAGFQFPLDWWCLHVGLLMRQPPLHTTSLARLAQQRRKTVAVVGDSNLDVEKLSPHRVYGDEEKKLWLAEQVRSAGACRQAFLS